MFRRLLLCFGLLVVALVAALAWAVSAHVEPGEARRRLLSYLALFGLCGALFVVLFSLALTRRFRRPLRELAEAVSRVGTGGVGPRVADEAGELAESFNRASEALTARLAQLEEDRQQLRTVLSGMVEGVVALDADQRLLFANDRAAELLELPTPAPVGR
ncbi:MAG: HAMP domain-containing protein, partial [Gemmataceae bacterium]